MAKHAGYTVQTDPEKTARSIGKEMPISPKGAVEVCRAIRGLPIEKARSLLEGVIAGKVAVPYRRHLYQIVHQKGGVGPGRFPRKVAKHVLYVLTDAESNAEYKGFDTEALRVAVAAAHHGRTWHQRMPRAHGRWTQKDRQTVNVEIVLEKLEE
ncbi:MAG: 50S ribosomal protein L22 [Euryarchaeota archaeon]|nr:50S ribosomal protein L22 [Euryarchaeota archaeon]